MGLIFFIFIFTIYISALYKVFMENMHSLHFCAGERVTQPGVFIAKGYIKWLC